MHVPRFEVCKLKRPSNVSVPKRDGGACLGPGFTMQSINGRPSIPCP
jgi:hypothetical protein